MPNQKPGKKQSGNNLPESKSPIAVVNQGSMETSKRIEPLNPTGPVDSIWQSLVANTPVLIIIADRDCRIRFANHTDSGATTLQMIGMSLDSFFPLDDRAAVRDCVRQVFETAKPGFFEGAVLRLDNQQHWFNLFIAPIFEDGQVSAVSVVAINATDRKRAQDALQKARDELELRVEERTAQLTKANEELKTIYDGMVDGLMVADLETMRLVRVNAAMCRLLGYAKDELLSRTIADVHPPEVVPGILQRLRTLNDGAMRLAANRLVLRKDQTIFFADINHIRLPYNGRPSIIALFRDVTERREAEEALRQSEEKCRGLLEACPDAVVMTDLKGNILFASRQAWRLASLPDSEKFIGRSMFDFMVEEDRQRFVENVPRLAEAGVRHYTEYTAVRVDGTTYPTESCSAMICDANGQPAAIVAVIRDITERKQAEAAIQQSHDELQAIYDGMTDAVVILNAETKGCIRANRAMFDLLGYTESELKALPPVALHPPELLPELIEKHEQLARGIIPQAEDIPFVRKNGRLVYVDVRMSPIQYNGQRCFLSLLHDVTERKQAQEQLQKEHRTLKHLLQSSDHERQLIAYEIHDGLAQQLAGAIMQFQTYAYQKAAHPKEAAKAFDAAVTMLKQGHFEARRLIAGVRPPILDESGVVAAVGHLVHEQSRMKGPKINYHSEVDFDRLAPALENSIYRIAQEALMNACRHSQSDRVKVSLLQRGDWVRIAIRDWGVGFDARAAQENRFGLVGIRQRARLLGGRCSIQSRPGKGTQITVDLPVVLKH